MLGIGMPEMILIAGLALVLLGPEKFPVFAKSTGSDLFLS